MRVGMDWKSSNISLWTGIVLIGVAVYFFVAAVALVSQTAPTVVAGLLSAIIGFVMLSAGTSLIKTYVVTRVLEQQETTTKKI